jgi:hypothetical protein
MKELSLFKEKKVYKNERNLSSVSVPTWLCVFGLRNYNLPFFFFGDTEV